MTDVYSISGKFDGANQIVQDFKSIEAQVRNVTKALKDNQAASKFSVQSQTRASNRQLNTTEREHQALLRAQTAQIHKQTEKYQGYIHAGREAGRIVREQVGYMRELATETMELSKAQEKFKTIGLSSAENERAFKAVKDTVGSVRGLNLAETTEGLLDIHSALGDLSHAIEVLPLASKYRFSFESLFGNKFSKQQIEEQIQNGMKFLEVTGAVAKGQEEMERRFNVMAQITAASGGRVTPADMLQMARRAGPAAQGLSNPGLRNVSTLIQELGGEGTGTALMSMYQALVGGVMKQSAAAEFMRLGLVDPAKVEFGKAQKIKKLMPGANKLGKLMQEDPLKAADELMKAMAKPLHGDAIDTTNADKVREELAILFGNRTAQKMMSILTTQRGQVVKEAALATNAKEIAQLYDQALESPAGKMLEFENALANFKSTIGGPVLGAMTDFAQGLKPIFEIMGDYPKISLATLSIAKFLSLIGPAVVEMRQFLLLQKLAAVGQLGSGAVPAQIGAGAASAKGAGIAGGIGLVGGTIIAAAAASFAYAAHKAMEEIDAREAAGQAGDRLGEALEKRFKERIGNLSAEVRAQMDKATAPQMAEDLIKQQRLSEASIGHTTGFKGMWERMTGQGPDGFAHYLNVSAATRDPRGKISYEDSGRVDDYRARIKSQLATSIASVEQLSEYLSQARKVFESQGRPELARELELLAGQALPQFADKVAATVAAQEQATQAVSTFTGALQSAAFQISNTTFSNMLGPGLPFTQGQPGMGRSVINPPRGMFNTGKEFNLPRRNYAKGGVIDRPTLALMGEGTEPEAVAPLSKLSKLVKAGRRGVRDVNVPVTIYGDAPVGIESRIASAVKVALAEHLESALDYQEQDFNLTAI